MTMLCATSFEIEQWLRSFRSNENPEDLVIVDNPRLFLSCRLAGSFSGKAYACFSELDGNESAVEISEPGDVFVIAAENCSAIVNFEIASQVENLRHARMSEEIGDIRVFSLAIEMLKALDQERGDLALSEWIDKIGKLPGSNHPVIQGALALAGDLHANMSND